VLRRLNWCLCAVLSGAARRELVRPDSASMQLPVHANRAHILHACMLEAYVGKPQGGRRAGRPRAARRRGGPPGRLQRRGRWVRRRWAAPTEPPRPPTPPRRAPPRPPPSPTAHRHPLSCLLVDVAEVRAAVVASCSYLSCAWLLHYAPAWIGDSH